MRRVPAFALLAAEKDAPARDLFDLDDGLLEGLDGFLGVLRGLLDNRLERRDDALGLVADLDALFLHAELGELFGVHLGGGGILVLIHAVPRALLAVVAGLAAPQTPVTFQKLFEELVAAARDFLGLEAEVAGSAPETHGASAVVVALLGLEVFELLALATKHRVLREVARRAPLALVAVARATEHCAVGNHGRRGRDGRAAGRTFLVRNAGLKGVRRPRKAETIMAGARATNAGRAVLAGGGCTNGFHGGG